MLFSVLIQTNSQFLQVFINPKLKVVDYKKVIHSEGCESVQGYLADVARYKAVQVTGNLHTFTISYYFYF